MKTMGMDPKFIFRAAILLMLFFLTGCADIRLNTLPNPAPTAKLRVFVLPVSGTLPKEKGNWKTPDAEFARNSYRATARMLNEKGIYTVVPPSAVQRVTGGQEIPGWQWEKNEWALAKKAGRALHADYLFIPMRGHDGFFYTKLAMINLETGKLYEKFEHVAEHAWPGCAGQRASQDSSANATRRSSGRPRGICWPRPSAKGGRRRRLRDRRSLKKQRKAREKSLRKGMWKKRGRPGSPHRTRRVRHPNRRHRRQPGWERLEKRSGSGAAAIRETGPGTADPMPQSAAAAGEPGDRRAVRSGPAEEKQKAGAAEEGKGSARQRMIVYDLQTTAQLNVVALILSEALREELFALGGFDLINREDMGQAIQEMKLQQSGLIDDRQALQIGKWLAANQTITGNLGIIGDAMILQTKRTDLQTMVILSRGSIRAGVGKEQELLDALHSLAQKLVAR